MLLRGGSSAVGLCARALARTFSQLSSNAFSAKMGGWRTHAHTQTIITFTLLLLSLRLLRCGKPPRINAHSTAMHKRHEREEQEERERKKAEAAKKWEDEKPQREAAAVKKKAIEDYNIKRSMINKKKIYERHVQLQKSKMAREDNEKEKRKTYHDAAEKRANKAHERQLEKAKQRYEETMKKAKQLGIKEEDLPQFDETAASSMGSSAADAIRFSSEINKRHSLMIERKKSHAMDVKHNEERNVTAESVQQRLAHEEKLRQKYRFELEEGKKSPFRYVSV